VYARHLVGYVTIVLMMTLLFTNFVIEYKKVFKSVKRRCITANFNHNRKLLHSPSKILAKIVSKPPDSESKLQKRYESQLDVIQEEESENELPSL